MDVIQSLDAVDRIVALRRVPMFADLDVADLEQVADLMIERRFGPQEPVFHRGEHGDEMMMIVAGQALVLVDGNQPIARNPGEHIGEMAVLRHQPRSADVVAGGNGLHGLVMNAATLQAALEERPEMALAMLTTLAERLFDAR